MIDVGEQKQIYVNWKFFSLKIINKDRKVKEDFRILHEIGLKALRVAAAVRRDYGNDGAGKLYTAMGTLYHHDEEDIDDIAVVEQRLEACNFPKHFSSAVDESSWDDDIQADMDQAIAKAGDDVGVPLIVLEGGQGPGFFWAGGEPGSDRQRCGRILGCDHRCRWIPRVFRAKAHPGGWANLWGPTGRPIELKRKNLFKSM